MADLISVQMTGHVAVAEMHRPPNNFFDEALLAALAQTLLALDEDGGVRCVVLCSAGKHFCAGAQLADGMTADGIRRLYRQAFSLFTVRKPVVAAVQGSAVGGGLGLALAADALVADVSSALDTEAQAQAALLGTADFREGVEAARARRDPVFGGG